MTADPIAPPLRGSSSVASTERGTPPERTSSNRASTSHATTWLPRNLHPIAWWIWALGLVVAASRTTNPFLLLAIVAAAGLVVMRRRGTAPWAKAFRWYLLFGVIIVVIRVATRGLLGGGAMGGAHVWFTLPRVPLPRWAAGITLGGPVSGEAVVAAACDGLRLATIIVCIGAANALANPKRALRVLPGALEELGVAVVISITVAPQLVAGVQRVRRARRLRGGADRGFRVLRSITLPVLHDALERSLALAAAMDSRGYGRRSVTSPTTRRLTVALLLGGLAALCVGVFGLLGGGTAPAVTTPAILAGVTCCAAGLWTGSRRVRRTAYAPDPWDVPESLVVLAGVVCAAVFVVAGGSIHGMQFGVATLRWPTLPLVPLVAVALAATPAVTAPRPPVRRVRASDPRGRSGDVAPIGATA
ncbi:MAG: energy-coupling factor transporter transmembrane protein EcfT [Actinobacteria bacterium]|nr:energy-coupling factor transporter transmembrane protein EcfT [Actinomycetota bacterium]